MKRWAVLVVGVYGVAVLVLSVPGLWVAFGFRVEAFEAYGVWVTWVWLGVMMLGMGALLLVPVGEGERRPRGRRRLAVAVVVSAFFMGLLILCGVVCGFVAAFGDRGPPSPLDIDGVWWVVIAGAGTVAMWVFWGVVFWMWRRGMVDTAGWMGRVMRWLLGGSVLELLVAVPSHIIVRQRGDCCAPLGTFFGMATGVAVMLMSFGPGVLFLYAKRMGMLRGEGKYCAGCGYDLRGSPGRCPECGREREAGGNSE